jgi:hypothetical protein
MTPRPSGGWPFILILILCAAVTIATFWALQRQTYRPNPEFILPSHKGARATVTTPSPSEIP